MRDKTIAGWLIGISLAITLFFCIRIITDGYWLWGGPIKYDTTGQVGDFIGGVIGTIFSAAGFYFLYLTLNEQRLSVAKERFESKFFDLIKLHRDNVSELKYSKFDDIAYEISEGRKVFRVIFLEFLDCLQEVRNFSVTKKPDDYIKPRYKDALEKIVLSINPKIDLYELATIDIAFCVVFYGLGAEGEVVLRRIFLKKYTDPYFYKLIKYLQVKPKKTYDEQYKRWSSFKVMKHDEKMKILDEIYERRLSDKNEGLSPFTLIYMNNLKCEKYYGGHQHRLGHYFRHLFQCYKFLNEQESLTNKEKYFYGKTLRAQLSTYEQALLFIDSISSLGFKWEFTPEYTYDKKLSVPQNEVKKSEQRLITKYNLIKNLPGDKYLDIIYKDYYPNVDYESDEALWPNV